MDPVAGLPGPEAEHPSRRSPAAVRIVDVAGDECCVDVCHEAKRLHRAVLLTRPGIGPAASPSSFHFGSHQNCMVSKLIVLDKMFDSAHELVRRFSKGRGGAESKPNSFPQCFKENLFFKND